MLPVALAAPLREALLAADFTYDAVSELLGPEAHQALSRNETTPGVRRTTDGSPLATLARLFLLQTAVPAADAERALPGLLDRLGYEDPELDGVEHRDLVRHLLVQLPEREQRILLLRYYSNLTQSQISAELGVSQMHVSRLLARSFARLRSANRIEA